MKMQNLGYELTLNRNWPCGGSVEWDEKTMESAETKAATRMFLEELRDKDIKTLVLKKRFYRNGEAYEVEAFQAKLAGKFDAKIVVSEADDLIDYDLVIKTGGTEIVTPIWSDGNNCNYAKMLFSVRETTLSIILWDIPSPC